MKFSDPATARTINRLRVLNLLRNDGAMSRADISRSLGLNKPSTSEIVASLIKEGLAEEGGKVETTSGRRPIAVSLKYDSHFVLGVELGSFTTSFSLSDLKGTILRYERLPTPPQPDAKEWGQKVIKSCMKFAPTTHLAGMVVATAATFTPDRKSILSHENWGWTEIPLAEAIEVHTKVPTILVHNVEAMVSAERSFAKEESETFLYINWAHHINAAWVNGSTVSSHHSRFGHLPIASTGLCQCGGIGCLETIAAGWALKEKGDGLSAKQLAGLNGSNALLTEACKAMATALIWAASITGAEKIILGGGIANIGEEYLQLIRDFYGQHAHHELASRPIVQSALKEQSTNLGSIAVALDHWIFKSSVLQALQGYEKPLPETE